MVHWNTFSRILETWRKAPSDNGRIEDLQKVCPLDTGAKERAREEISGGLKKRLDKGRAGR